MRMFVSMDLEEVVLAVLFLLQALMVLEHGKLLGQLAEGVHMTIV